LIVEKKTITVDEVTCIWQGSLQEAFMMPSSAAEAQPLALLLGQLEDMTFVDACGSLVKAAFLFTNRPGAPHQAHGLNVAQADVLLAIARAENTELKCLQISKRTLITKGGITKILDRLEGRGLIRRMTSGEDRRSRSVQLTAKGVELCRELIPEVARSDREIFEKAFRAEQMNQFRNLLMLLIRELEEESLKAQTRASERPELKHFDHRTDAVLENSHAIREELKRLRLEVERLKVLQRPRTRSRL
jgi:MarR family transcriptional regulator, 2-MHQ and catechol-resistance regulon repressor